MRPSPLNKNKAMRAALLRTPLLAASLIACTAFAQQAAPPGAGASNPGPPNTAPVVPQPASPGPADAPPGQRPPSVGDAQNQAMEALQKSAVWQTYMSVLMDLRGVVQEKDLQTRLEQLDHFQFSAGTKQKLQDLFGNADPLHLKFTRRGPAGGELAFNLDALDHRDADSGDHFHASALRGKALYSKRYTRAHASGLMPLLTFEYGKSLVQFTAKSLGFSADEALGMWDMWFGTASFKLDQLEVDHAQSGTHVVLKSISAGGGITRHGDLIDVDEAFTVKSVNWGKGEVGPVHMAFRFANLDGQTIAAFGEKIKSLGPEAQNQNPQERAALFVKLFKELVLASAGRGAAFEIRDISVGYHHRTAGLSARVTFENLEAGDFDTPGEESGPADKVLPDAPRIEGGAAQRGGPAANPAIPKAVSQKLVARTDIHVPVAMLRDMVSLAVKQGAPAAKAHDAEAKAQERIETTLKQLTQSKMIHVEKGVILSTIEWKAGKMTINGQPFAMPSMPRPPAVPPAPPSPPAGSPPGTP